MGGTALLLLYLLSCRGEGKLYIYVHNQRLKEHSTNDKDKEF
jgi:predicted GIY-YIG superfamily endonuclease